MCYACNPSCGRCRPKRVISIECPQCGAPHSLKREEFLLLFDLPHNLSILEKKMIERGGVAAPVCETCGADLADAYRSAMPPAPCRRYGIICGYPCGRSGEEPESGQSDCAFMVPMQAIEAEA